MSKKDIHTQKASELFGVPYDKVTKQMRYQAKKLNFTILYGGLGNLHDLTKLN